MSQMNKSVPTLLGLVIILLVVVLVVLIVNYQTTKGLGEGKQVVGTIGGEMLTGEEAPEEVIGASTVTGSREPEPAGATRITPEQQERMGERRQQVRETREQSAETGRRAGGAPAAGE